MRAGDLRRRVTLQSRSTTQDAYGGQVNTWSDLVVMWADIAALTGRELEAAKAVQTEVTHHVTVRYQSIFADPKAVAAMRIVYNNRYFNIHACLNVDERNREINLLCSEGMNEG